jgi:hypothetical protein
VVKMARYPTSEEVQRLRERWDREDAEEIPLKPFDTTLTSGISDTVQHLMRMPADRRASVESNQLRFDALQQLTAEARFIRESLAKVIETLNHKASKRAVKKAVDEYTAKFDKRVDNIFKLVTAIAAIFSVVFAVFSFSKGHS